MPREFITHRSVELMNGLKIFARFLETRPVSQEGLFDTCARKFYGLLSHFVVYVLFVVNQTFEIVCIRILVSKRIGSLPIIWKIAIILRKLSGFLF